MLLYPIKEKRLKLMLSPLPLTTTAQALRTNQLDLASFIESICQRIDALESQINALLPEPGRRARLLAEARSLQERFPDPASRPALYGVLLGVKDVFNVDGFQLVRERNCHPRCLQEPRRPA